MKRDGEQTREIRMLVSKTGMSVAQVRRVIYALADEVRRNRRTEIRGLGVFTWRLFRGRTPAGKKFRSARLWFHSKSLKFKGAMKELEQ